ncbi:MAG: penicillin-binding protein [Bacteroidales bacterium]|nr:penicillin-binding protein [Bacteroidales bacterium]
MTEKTKRRLIITFWSLFSCAVLTVVLSITGVILFADIPSVDDIERPDMNLATRIMSEDGQVLATYHLENRIFIDYEDISPYMVQAAVATEDVRFYEHSGIDYRSLARVAVKTILGGNASQGGGSTITQQLAKILYTENLRAMNSDDPGVAKKRRGKVGRMLNLVKIKLIEWVTAVRLERRYTKDEIMMLYMNKLDFGNSAFGIRAAAMTYFGKSPIDLTVEEAATILGIINKTSRYNPVRNPDESFKRRNFVMGQMVKAGYLTQEQKDSLAALPIVLSYSRQDHHSGLGLYFKDMLLRTMNAKQPKRNSYYFKEDYIVDSLQWANDPLYGWLNKNFKPDGSKYNLFTDGLCIRTTINSKMQRYAEEAVAEHLGKDLQKSFWRDIRYKKNKPFSDDIDEETVESLMKQARRWSDRYRMMKADGHSESEIARSFNEPTKMRVFSWNKKGYIDTVMTPNDSIRYYKSHLRAAIMAIEPQTGHVRAYVGGPHHSYFQYDNVRQGKRQVGSTIKPFLYTLAMQEGLTPCDKVVNVPQTFVVGDTTWTPKSTDKDDWIGQTVTLKWGLTKSSNNISAYLMKLYGPHAMADMMRKMGIGSHIDETYSLCVGSADISVYDMVAAYNTFPSKGVYVTPLFVTRIEDKYGNTLGEFSNRKKEAISEHTAYLMANLMQGVVNSGTGIRLRAKYQLKGEIAGKTGTTNNQSDGWFIGYTPKITAGVWVGAEDRSVHFESLSLGGGSNMALPIWGIFMQKVLADKSLGFSETDRFVAPPGTTLDLNCDGSDADAEATQEDEGSFFFE